MQKVLFILLGILLPQISSLAENQYVSANIKGEWGYNSPFKETALFFANSSWIWNNDPETEILLARKKFDLSELPSSSYINISATDLYQLYINGKYVFTGPARSASHHQSFDRFDISSLLKVGENIIAVRSSFNGGGKSYYMNKRAGLLLSLFCENKQLLVSDKSWKVTKDLSWKSNGYINSFQLYKNESVDFRKYYNGWIEIEYDDSFWDNATVLNRNEGWPSVQKNSKSSYLVTPWTSLVKRDIPYLNDSYIKAVKLLSCFSSRDEKNISKWNIDNRIEKKLLFDYNNYKNKAGSFDVKVPFSCESVTLLFDLEDMHTATGRLLLSGKAGTKIKILYSPFLINGVFNKNVAKSDYEDEIILSGSDCDVWEAVNYKPIRYLAVKILGSSSEIKFHWIGVHSFSYPFVRKGTVSSDDADWVLNYMDATDKTLRHCTTDAYTDNYREKRQYAQTGYYASLGNYYTFGDYSLQRRYLLQIAQEQYANGIMPAYAPLADLDYMVILDSNCLWLRGLYNYYLYSGDKATVEYLLPFAKKLITLLFSFTDHNGLITDPPYAYWLDHAALDRRGANFLLNFHYYGALHDYSALLELLCKDGSFYSSEALKIKSSLLNLFWDEKKGLFVDAYINGEKSCLYSEHSNAAALCLMDKGDKRVVSIVNQLLYEYEFHDYVHTRKDLVMVTPAMSYFLHKGLCSHGYINESFTMFRQRFDKMLNIGNKTLWEEWWLDGSGRSGKLVKMLTRSDAQTESAFFPALATEYLLGFKPIEEGMKTCVLEYVNMPMKHIKATIPTPYGDLKIERMEEKENKGMYKLNIPSGISLRINNCTFMSNVKINGVSVKDNDKFYPLHVGEHMIEY